MKIAKIELFEIPPRWLFLRIETDNGIVGWGEPVIEGRAAVVRAAVEALRPVLLGADPTRIEDLWQVCTRGGFYRGGPILSSAVAGIDQALWDIRGKSLGVPVYELLGGLVRDKVPAYSWIGGDSPEDVGQHASNRIAEGFTYFKMNVAGILSRLPTTRAIDGVLQRVQEVNSVTRTAGRVAIDFHGRAELPTARALLRELKDCNPLFVEEPLRPELSFRLNELCAETAIPIATGERLFTRQDFYAIMNSGIAIAQPDVSHAGGISETRRIANLVETVGVGIAPHSPLGPIALASSLQIDFSCHNALFQETSLGIHYNHGHDLLSTVENQQLFALQDGAFMPPKEPGLGVKISEDAVRDLALVGHNWTNPIWRDEDGAFVEW